MKFYNNYNGIYLFILLFILWAINMGGICSCDNPDPRCIRHEFYGVQLNHFFLFLILGFIFPSFFFILMLLGLTWEIFEYFLEFYEKFTMEIIGGCLAKAPFNHNEKNNKPSEYIVYRDIPKYMNPIDKFVGIENSKKHTWHGSVAELIPNFLGFCTGYFINRLLI